VRADYASLHLSLRSHPLAFLRTALASQGITSSAGLGALPHGVRVTVAGLVLVRQRPGSASGVIFATLEDETGSANIIIWPTIFARFRRVVLSARLMGVTGQLQREGIVMHVIAERVFDLSASLARLGSSEEKPALARTDETARPHHDKRLYPSRDFH
jgi:error-prone DNA polymerase